MAEAAVEDRPLQKFYCHMCNVNFESSPATFTCPHCSDGFVEELMDQPEANDESFDYDDWEAVEEGVNVRDFFSGLLDDRHTGRSRSLDGNRPSRTRRPLVGRPTNPFENIFQDVIINLGVNLGNSANMQLFLGNPGDYAWGREGLDAIITQLLNQMDSTGPPPVSKDIIDALPVVDISREQVGMKLQCSVCWEDFVLHENVRQLPCQHVYHEPCIRPWLELHGTCPICRQNLSNGEQSDSSGRTDGAGSSSIEEGGRRAALEVLTNLYGVTSNMRNASTSSSSTSDSSADQTRTRSTDSDSAM